MPFFFTSLPDRFVSCVGGTETPESFFESINNFASTSEGSPRHFDRSKHPIKMTINIK